MSDERKISVSVEPLRELLTAFNGPSYLVRELQAIRGITKSPIDQLIQEFNEEIRRLNEEKEQTTFRMSTRIEDMPHDLPPGVYEATIKIVEKANGRITIVAQFNDEQVRGPADSADATHVTETKK